MAWTYWTILLLSTLAALLVAARLRDRWGIEGPDRIPPDEPATPYLLALGVGLVTWVMVPQIYLGAIRTAAPATAPVSQPGQPQLSHLETVTLGNIMNLAPLALMITVYASVRPAGLRRLGLGAGDLPRAVVPGLAGALFAIPMMAWLGMLLTWLYRKLGVEHPLKHELLEILDASPDLRVRALMLFGAAVAAPLFEELMFRGHIQTLLADGLSGRLRLRTMAALPSSSAPPPQSPTLASAPPDLLPAGPSPALRWMAVVITSALFAAVHPWWSQPAIFILSLCLGYAYERTGNLYVPMLIHFLFNASSILHSLYGT